MKRLKQLICLCLAGSFMALTAFAAPANAIQTLPTFEFSSDAASIVDEVADDDWFDDLSTSDEQDASSSESSWDDIFADDIWSDEEGFEDDPSISDDLEHGTTDFVESAEETDLDDLLDIDEEQTSLDDLLSQAEPDADDSLPNDSAPSSTIGGKLDGDYAYISDAGLVSDPSTDSRYAISTGTSPWDESSTTPGNDATENNNIVRSFDIVNYTTWFRSKVRADAPYSAYETGTLCFEFILPGDSSKIQFEEGSMGWLTAKKEATYEITKGTYDGNPCQILRGSYLWEPSEGNPSAIGESYQELNIALRVLAMHNNEIVQPLFTYWLDFNDVPNGTVTGSDQLCTEHLETEYKTITPPEITVTAAPHYNIQLKAGDTRASYISSFDFSTGNAYAMNQDAGDVYGRISVIGITIQLMGKDAEHGLRGCELPDGNDLTFTLNLSDEYLGNDGRIHDTTDTYTPLVWSLEGNDKNDHTKHQYDEREITGKYKLAAGGAHSISWMATLIPVVRMAALGQVNSPEARSISRSATIKLT